LHACRLVCPKKSVSLGGEMKKYNTSICSKWLTSHCHDIEASRVLPIVCFAILL